MRLGSALRSPRFAYRPWMEPLENRDCPTGMTPTLSFSTLAVGPTTYRLSGSVMDEAPAGLIVQFTGVYAGSTQVDPSGNYSMDVTPSQLGAITAAVTDNEGLTATQQGSLTSLPPTITLSASRQVNNLWVFSGTVTDEHAAGLTVRFGGLPTIDGRTTTVAANGTFSFTAELAPGEEGTATAKTTDWWGLNSNLAEYMIHPAV